MLTGAGERSEILSHFEPLLSISLSFLFQYSGGDLMRIEDDDQPQEYTLNECPQCGLAVEHLFTADEWILRCRDCGWDSNSVRDDEYLFSSPL